MAAAGGDPGATAMPPMSRHERWIDIGLSALLALQGVTLFLVIPLNHSLEAGGSMLGRVVIDGCHLVYAAICIGILTRHRLIRLGLSLGLVVLVAGPALAHHLSAGLAVSSAVQHEVIAAGAFLFNAGVTAIVARHVLAPGRVNAHRIRGAILLYLNVAALFAIAFGVIAVNFPTPSPSRTARPRPIPAAPRSFPISA
jgi:hypothetical protein